MSTTLAHDASMSPSRSRALRPGLIALSAWLVLVTLVVALGYGPGPFTLPPAVAVLLVTATLLLTTTGPLIRTVDALGVRGLTLFHAWRIAPGVAFICLGFAGVLPVAFARNAGWGDLAVGVLALASLPALLAHPGRGVYVAFHVFGLADLFVAVGTASWLTWTLASDAVPSMTPMTTLPLILIPLAGVPISGATHLVAFGRLRASAKAK